MFIETVMGSEAKVKVARTLLESKIAYSMQDIKQLTGLSIGAIHKVISGLLQEGLIIQKKGRGKQRFYQANLENKYAARLSSVFDDERNGRKSVPLHVWNRLGSICSELKAKIEGIKDIILFGSLARGEFRISSDVDLLILTENNFNNEAKARKICRHTDLKNKINPIFAAEKEWFMHESKKSDFYESILKEGIRLV